MISGFRKSNNPYKKNIENEDPKLLLFQRKLEGICKFVVINLRASGQVKCTINQKSFCLICLKNSPCIFLKDSFGLHCFNPKIVDISSIVYLLRGTNEL